MTTSEALRLTVASATTEVMRLGAMAENAAATLAAVEQRALTAEAALARLKKRQAQIRTAPADLVAAARALLDRMDTITTAQFACGAEKAEREALRAVLDALEDAKR